MDNTPLHHFFNMLIIEQDYFECHEIMEDAWKNKPLFTKTDKEVFLILIATAEYHYRRGNLIGAEKTFKKALKIYNEFPFDLEQVGLKNIFIDQLKERSLILKTKKFQPMKYPLTNEVFDLLYRHSGFTDKNKFKTFIESNIISDHYLIHRHKLRDRSDVIRERLEALNIKKRD